jgi:hypothetical protein
VVISKDKYPHDWKLLIFLKKSSLLVIYGVVNSYY